MDRGAEVDTEAAEAVSMEEEVAAFTEVAAACTAADHRAALLEEWVLLTAAACTAADPTVAMEPTDDRTATASHVPTGTRAEVETGVRLRGTRAARVVLTQGTQLARTRITMRQQDRTQDHLRAIPPQVLPLRMARGDRTRLR